MAKKMDGSPCARCQPITKCQVRHFYMVSFRKARVWFSKVICCSSGLSSFRSLLNIRLARRHRDLYSMCMCQREPSWNLDFRTLVPGQSSCLWCTCHSLLIFLKSFVGQVDKTSDAEPPAQLQTTDILKGELDYTVSVGASYLIKRSKPPKMFRSELA